jgi:hypothetical protein
MNLEPTWGKLKEIRSRLMGAGNPSLLDAEEVSIRAPLQSPQTTEAV